MCRNPYDIAVWVKQSSPVQSWQREILLPKQVHSTHSVYILKCFLLVDLDRVLKEEAAGEADGWKFVKTADVGEVWKKSVPDSPVQLVKVLPLEK